MCDNMLCSVLQEKILQQRGTCTSKISFSTCWAKEALLHGLWTLLCSASVLKRFHCAVLPPGFMYHTRNSNLQMANSKIWTSFQMHPNILLRLLKLQTTETKRYLLNYTWGLRKEHWLVSTTITLNLALQWNAQECLVSDQKMAPVKICQNQYSLSAQCSTVEWVPKDRQVGSLAILVEA